MFKRVTGDVDGPAAAHGNGSDQRPGAGLQHRSLVVAHGDRSRTRQRGVLIGSQEENVGPVTQVSGGNLQLAVAEAPVQTLRMIFFGKKKGAKIF
jgi:hypothetical protein